MKILVISNMGPSKGAPNYGVFIKNFCERLSVMGFDYNWIYIKKNLNKAGKFISYIIFFLRTFFACLLGKYSCIYIHYLSISSIPVIFASKLKKSTIICNAHGSDLAPETIKQEKVNKYTRKILKKSSVVVVPSEYFKNYLYENYKNEMDKQKVFVYPSGGVNPRIFHVINKDEKDKIFKKLKLDKDIKYIGYCGRIDKNKGIDTLLEAFLKLSDLSIELIIVGSGSYEDVTHEKINAFKLEKRVHFFSMMTQAQLRDVYNLIDIFIFPTEREGESLGLVAVEAMACGTPVIASDYAAPKYYIHDGFNGYKFSKGNVNELKEKIENVIYDEDKLAIMSNNASSYAKKYYVENTDYILQQIFECV